MRVVVVAVFCLATATEPKKAFHLTAVASPLEAFFVVHLAESASGILADRNHTFHESEQERGDDDSTKHFKHVRVGGSEGYCLRPVPEHDIDDLHALILARVNHLEFFQCCYRTPSMSAGEARETTE